MDNAATKETETMNTADRLSEAEAQARSLINLCQDQAASLREAAGEDRFIAELAGLFDAAASTLGDAEGMAEDLRNES